MNDERSGTSSLQKIIELHYEDVREFFVRRTNSPQIAADLVQNTFLKLAQVKWLERKADRAYIYKVARSVWADYCARENRQVSPSDWRAVQSVNAIDLDSDQVQVLRRRIEELPQECRAILVLRLFQGYTFREAGEILSVPETTLVARYNKAVRCLKKVINSTTT